MGKKGGGGKIRGKGGNSGAGGLSPTMIGGAVVAIAVAASMFYSSGSPAEAEEMVGGMSKSDLQKEVSRQLEAQKQAAPKHTPETDYTGVDKWANKCRNTHKDCDMWAGMGECEKNKGFMLTGCPRSCDTCDQLDPAVRCKRPASAQPAIKEGDLEAMFANIVDSGKFAHMKPEVKSRDPWMIYFDQFVTPDEIDDVWRVSHTIRGQIEEIFSHMISCTL